MVQLSAPSRANQLKPVKISAKKVSQLSAAADEQNSWMRLAETVVVNKPLASSSQSLRGGASSWRAAKMGAPSGSSSVSSSLSAATTHAATTSLLRQLVHYHLDNLSVDNAHFYAERLAAHDPRAPESADLLALCHLRRGDNRSAYEVAKPFRTSHVGCALVYAQACLTLGRYRDGVVALEKARPLWTGTGMSLGKHSSTSRAPGPDGAVIACLLGKLYKALQDKKKAIGCFEEALTENPYMWDAFTSLCDMGVQVRIPNTFWYREGLLQSFDLEPNRPSEPRDGVPSQADFPFTTKASSLRDPVVWDQGADLFEPNRTERAASEVPSAGGLFSGEAVEENNFMAKIAAARSKLGAAPAVPDQTGGMETPPGHTSANESIGSRGRRPSDPPPAPAVRKTRGAQNLVDASILDAPPKMSYRLGAKRPLRAQDRSTDPADISGDNSSALRASAPLSSSLTDRKRTVSGHPVNQRQPQLGEPGAPYRRSARLNMFQKPTGVKAASGAATIGASAGRELKRTRQPISRVLRPGSSDSTVGRVVSGNRKPIDENGGDNVDHAEAPRIKEVFAPPSPPKTVEPPESAKVEEAMKWILELLRKLGAGYHALSHFRLEEALETQSLLPRSQQETPFVLALMGRAHYEQANYAEADKFFRRLRSIVPTRMEDMEVYSTILWFLKRERDLSFLAHELIDADWHSPQAWCALGNAWSLCREHEQALKCFKRATQLNPNFAYAFTLQGHEHVANEEYEKALTSYRMAITADRRHYNAYYGIGRVYEKLGSYDKAHTHFKTASAINPTNAVLVCCIGTVLEKQKQIGLALKHYTHATNLAPRAAQTRYKKARALLATNRLEEARAELMILKDLAPDEATVHFLLGRLHKTLGEKGLAIRHYTIALNLDPKVSSDMASWRGLLCQHACLFRAHQALTMLHHAG